MVLLLPSQKKATSTSRASSAIADVVDVVVGVAVVVGGLYVWFSKNQSPFVIFAWVSGGTFASWRFQSKSNKWLILWHSLARTNTPSSKAPPKHTNTLSQCAHTHTDTHSYTLRVFQAWQNVRPTTALNELQRRRTKKNGKNTECQQQRALRWVGLFSCCCVCVWNCCCQYGLYASTHPKSGWIWVELAGRQWRRRW